MESASPARTDRRLNPTTRLVMAGCAMALALAGPRWVPPLIVLAVFLMAVRAGRLRGLAAVVAALLPLLISTLLVNQLWPAGGHRGDGWRYALVVLALSLPPALVLLITPIEECLADLEAHGVPPGAAFMLASAVAAIPSARARALRVADARRARGLDGGGGPWARVRGLLELTAPVVYGSLRDVEDRTLALEARGFGRVRRRTLLGIAPDGAGQRFMRWSLPPVSAAIILAGALIR